jgi:hypothetical protein
MYRSDWSIRPNGQAFLDLVFHDWWTDVDLASDANGQATVRAFKGDHNVSGSFGGFTSTVLTTLTTGGKLQQIALPFVLGDYNHNGIVDAADYTVWRDTLGRSVAVGIGADGNGDGLIDAEDLNVWRQHFGEKLPAGSASNVPEPSSLLLASVAAAICLLAMARRRHRRMDPAAPLSLWQIARAGFRPMYWTTLQRCS